jgi:hypothetical protein
MYHTDIEDHKVPNALRDTVVVASFTACEKEQLVYDDKLSVRGSFRSIGHYTTISFSVKFMWFSKLQGSKAKAGVVVWEILLRHGLRISVAKGK